MLSFDHSSFVVLDGVGVTVSPGAQIYVHLPVVSRLELAPRFGFDFHRVSGWIVSPGIHVRLKNFVVGQRVRLYSLFYGRHSRPFTVEAIFESQLIHSVVKPSLFLDHLKEETFPLITSAEERLPHTALIKNLVFEALRTNSWEFRAMHRQPTCPIYQGSAITYLEDLTEAGLVEIYGNTICLLDPLIFLLMHAVNKQRRYRVFDF